VERGAGAGEGSHGLQERDEMSLIVGREGARAGGAMEWSGMGG